MSNIYRTGARVRAKPGARLYSTEDPPTAPSTGSVPAGVEGKITLGPHMGKSYVKFEDGSRGWVANGDLDLLS